MSQELICIRCPLGCLLQVEHEAGGPLRVEGNRCRKGLEYAEQEMLHPERIVTTTVRLLGADLPLLPVRTTAAVSRDLVFQVIREASRLAVEAPVQAGQVLIAGILGAGADLIATRSVPRREPDGPDVPVRRRQRFGRRREGDASGRSASSINR